MTRFPRQSSHTSALVVRISVVRTEIYQTGGCGILGTHLRHGHEKGSSCKMHFISAESMLQQYWFVR
jgi:hypothetical protein